MSLEKIYLVLTDFRKKSTWTIDDHTYEMTELVKASGGEVVGQTVCRVDDPKASTLISKGKISEIAMESSRTGAETIVFSCELKGSQQRNLEEEFGQTKTIDRTQLILDIFAKHATSQEGKMQVELAQLQYLLPRLTGKGVQLSRLGGGIGTLGPGETKLETDRRRINMRITKLKRALKSVSASRDLKRKKRRDNQIPTVSLVGYTNAGKTTLLNYLTHADQITRDGLFTTLDSVSRRFLLPNHQEVVFTDTVGFMHDLPHGLIEAFHATLEEVQKADLLLHVVDCSHPNFLNFYQSVKDVLRELEVADKPTVVVLNKCDKLDDTDLAQQMVSRLEERAVAISALHGWYVNDLHDVVADQLADRIVDVQAKVPLDRMDLIHLAHEHGNVLRVDYQSDCVDLHVTLPAKWGGVFKEFLV